MNKRGKVTSDYYPNIIGTSNIHKYYINKIWMLIVANKVHIRSEFMNIVNLKIAINYIQTCFVIK
jgi:hypothetical protein